MNEQKVQTHSRGETVHGTVGQPPESCTSGHPVASPE